MAFIVTRFFSETLGMCATVNAIIPQPSDLKKAKSAYPVLTVLHGYGQNVSSWIRMSGIEALAYHYGFAVLMPDAFLSSYTDMVHGQKFETYLTEEMPRVMRGFYPLSDKREENYILGCSMGGYGALRLGLRHAENYSVIGSLSSGHRSIPTFIGRRDERGFAITDSIFGENGSDSSDNETEAIAQKLSQTENRPRIFMRVSDNDPYTLENCRQSRDFFSKLPFETDYAEKAGGHNWLFWNEQLNDFFEFCKE